mmetsp:Transcript_16172/g.21153  ORF Transcript_16172/g.21153 Transcript_16172/m.21153 type:complete len:86 (-) Transcript_16172:206-463(-)
MKVKYCIWQNTRMLLGVLMQDIIHQGMIIGLNMELKIIENTSVKTCFLILNHNWKAGFNAMESFLKLFSCIPLFLTLNMSCVSWS